MSASHPFMKGASRHSMAIKTLDPADWIAFGDDRPHQLQARRLLLDQRPNDVLAALPGSEAGQAELASLLLEHLQRYSSDIYTFETDSVVERDTGLRLSTRGPRPIELAGRLVQEDFCLLQKRDGRYCLVAAVLCFPGHWSLREKLGLPLIGIHEPVPGFAEQLGDPVTRLFDNLKAERPVQRLNWSLVDTDELYLPPSHRAEAVAIDVDEAGARLRLRMERQTLRRLKGSGDVVFGIRTYVTPLVQAIDTGEAADALIQRLHELPAPMRVYKNLEVIREPLLAYLERRRATLGDTAS